MTGPEIVEMPADSVVFEWRSPAFDTAPPDVRNGDLIPRRARDAMTPAWGTRRFPETAVRLHRLRDVFVVGEGLVLDRGLRVVRESMTQYSAEEAGVERERVRAAVAGGRVIEDRGTVLLCQKRGMGNFGHWLIELLPRAHLGMPWLKGAAWRVLAPGDVGEMDVVVRDSLAMLGVPEGLCVFGDGAPRQVEELLVMHGLTWHGWFMSPLVMDCMDALMAGVAAEGAERVWVSREDRHRSLWNEAEAAAVLARLGWRVLRPSRMRLRDQVAAFRNARQVAGVLGAGLTGTVFAPAGTRVTSFAPAEMPDTFFWLLTTLRAQVYKEVRAPGLAGFGPWDGALLVGLPELLRYLAE